MSIWIKSDTKQQVDTSLGQGIQQDGTYYLVRTRLALGFPALFGAQVKEAGHTATVQLFAEIAAAKQNIGSALVPTSGSPAILSDEITLTGERGITVSGLTGTVYPEVSQ